MRRPAILAVSKKPDAGPGVLDTRGLDALLCALRHGGFEVIGPTLRDGAIIYDKVECIEDLPAGWTDEQDGGHYRLKRRQDQALFGYVVGPHAIKRFLHPPVQSLWQATKTESGYRLEATAQSEGPFAFLGVRPCDIKAMAVQDRVLQGGAYKDVHYQARREGAFVVVVNCGQAGGTCFCTSMKSGPRAENGFDLALTELDPAGDHRFLVEVGSNAGAALLVRLPVREARTADLEAAAEISARTATSMERAMPTEGLRDLLMRHLEHPRWNDVAERCLSCGNCTMVCPTCFCTQTDEDMHFDEVVGRTRQWTSCFSLDFSYIHGGSVRHSARSRYRQWMTHKLATWHDQFGESGCVGCGRCITWCPVGIDITAEVNAIKNSETD